MKILIAGATGAIVRPLVAQLLAKGHELVALTRSPEKALTLAQQGVKPAIADVFDADAVYYGTQMRGASNAKAKRELNFQPRPLEWLVGTPITHPS